MTTDAKPAATPAASNGRIEAMTQTDPLVEELRSHRLILKSGDYDGADLMRAWCCMIDAAARILADTAKIEVLVKALESADQFITNGIALGYIRMPDADTPDPAKLTPGIIRQALAAAKETEHG